MRRQPLVQLLVTLAIVAIANVASELGKPVSRALSDGESDGPSAWPSRNKEEERMGAETTPSWAEHLFKMLRLHNVNQLFERRRFRLWVQIMKLFHRKNPESAMLLTLHSMYKDEEVATMIMAAKRVSKTQSFAKKLQEEQLQLWKREKKSPEEVFVWLQLDNKEARDLVPLVSNPEFVTWKEYLKLIAEKPEEVKKMMVETLLAQYTEQKLAQMLRASTDKEHLKIMTAADQEKMKNMAHELQLQMWQTTGKSPDDVFDLLQLGKVKNDGQRDLSALIKSPRFDTWKEYIRSKYSLEEVNKVMIETLTTRYSDQGDKGLAQLLLPSRYKDSDLTSVKELVKALQVTQQQLWVEKKVAPETVSRWMAPEGEHLEKADEDLLKNYGMRYDLSHCTLHFAMALDRYFLAFLRLIVPEAYKTVAFGKDRVVSANPHARANMVLCPALSNDNIASYHALSTLANYN
ncbi:hypothetical protein PsorP6_015619 [Peronosclerospora sorghi]|uniref:Uncharacterized protein n=1 Tax=Peronosclerospora sorghi TaxID=230839 RepID=A0ACC0WR30_9STRA|nr:hypothetical protein PsorP6_015619 [Peronosclerospora sorghi]